jgi:hypothetical protein
MAVKDALVKLVALLVVAQSVEILRYKPEGRGFDCMMQCHNKVEATLFNA